MEPAMTEPTKATPKTKQGNSGGTYGHGDISPAAQRSKMRQTRAGEVDVPKADPPQSGIK
jgi:hypothetical protein